MAKTKLIPLADRVVVTRGIEKKLVSGIILPDTATKDRPEYGTVVAVGRGRVSDTGARVPLEVVVGDTVVFPKYGMEEVTVDGVEYYILREDQILAIIK